MAHIITTTKELHITAQSCSDRNRVSTPKTSEDYRKTIALPVRSVDPVSKGEDSLNDRKLTIDKGTRFDYNLALCRVYRSRGAILQMHMENFV